MPIIFTPGLKPELSDTTFGTEKEHVKRIFDLLNSETAYSNILETPLANLVTRIDVLTAELVTDYDIADTEKPTIEGYSVVPIDPVTGQAAVDPITGLPYTNLPEGWDEATYTVSDITDVVSAIDGYLVANELIRTNLAILKIFITTADDTFKLHNDLLSGIREDPPVGVIKPTLRGLMSLVTSLTTLENRFGIPFVNYLEKVFGTLFTGDVTISNAQAFHNISPLPITYASLDVVTRIGADPFEETPTDIISDISGLLGTSTYASTVLVHRDNFQTHITNDTAEYNAIADKLDRLIQSLNISGYISDDYYKFMYTDVFGSDLLKQIIFDKDNGSIT